MLVEPSFNSVLVSLVILEEDFHFREETYIIFPFEVNNSTIRKAIGRFQMNIKDAEKYMDYVCCCCC